MAPRSIVIAIAGASGSIYAQRMLKHLTDAARGLVLESPLPLEIHWLASPNAGLVWEQELGEPLPDVVEGAQRWDLHDFRAPFASGSNAADAVIVIPCSMSRLARVAHGGGSDLISRACDVALKERKRLILVARETPLSLVHLRNMTAATEAGALILPAVPSFYGHVETLEQAVDTVVARALDRAGVELPIIERWGRRE